jgi:hypothetical protein
MDEFKFRSFADIPAYFIVIKIHVGIKRIFFQSEKLKNWLLLNPTFGSSKIIYLTTRLID